MKIYFYCSYEHSRRGFFLTRLEENGLVPAEEGQQVPEIIWEFFSYDRYSFLWRDLCPPVKQPWQRPQCTGSFCGVRNLRGSMADGRNGTVNLAFLAEPEEEALLRRTALAILADYSGFRSMIFAWLSVGEPCGYRLDAPAFQDWLRRCGSAGQLRRLVAADAPAARLLSSLQCMQPPRLERDTLRLAACTCAWREIYEAAGSRPIWRLRPQNAITQEQFDAAFSSGPVWTLEHSNPPEQQS